MFIIDQHNYKTSIDPDVKAFLLATGINDNTTIVAITYLVENLKLNSIWDKIAALYPFVGGSADTHKYNLKDPRDLDVAFRLSFVGTWTHNSNGIIPSGTNSHADTFLLESNIYTNYSLHYSWYSRTNNSSLTVDVGASVSATNTFTFTNFGGNTYYKVHDGATNILTVNNSAAFYLANRITANESRNLRNSTRYIGAFAVTSAPVPYSFYIGAANNTGTPAFRSVRNLAFVSIGNGLSDSDADNLYTIVQNFQTLLNRNI